MLHTGPLRRNSSNYLHRCWAIHWCVLFFLLKIFTFHPNPQYLTVSWNETNRRRDTLLAAKKLRLYRLKDKIWNKLNPCAALYRPASAQILWPVSSWRSGPDWRLLWLLHSLLTSTSRNPASKIKAHPFKRIQDWLTDWYFSPFSRSHVCLCRT